MTGKFICCRSLPFEDAHYSYPDLRPSRHGESPHPSPSRAEPAYEHAEEDNPFERGPHPHGTPISALFSRKRPDREHSYGYRTGYGTIPFTPVRTYEIMRKWNIRYSGARNDDPDAFSTRIEEDHDLVPVSDANSLRVVPFFFYRVLFSAGSAVLNICDGPLDNLPGLLGSDLETLTSSLICAKRYTSEPRVKKSQRRNI